MYSMQMGFLLPLTLKGEMKSRSNISISRTQLVTNSHLSSGQFLSIGQAIQSKDIIDHEEKMQYSTFDLKAYNLKKRTTINQALDKAVPLKEPIKIHEAIRYTLLSDGKRVLSTLCIACCELVGGDETTALPAACSMEMIVACHHILDDLPCMDNDDLRRGKPSNHKVFGEHMSIYASSSLSILAFEHVLKATLGLSSENVLRVISEWVRLMGPHQGIIAGQMADMEYAGRSDVGVKELEYIHLHKAATFFEASVVAGAIVGGATDEQIERLRMFSRTAGLLFMVVDDILDVTRSTQELGKTAGKDLIADKLTYPKIFGIEKSREFAEKLRKDALDQLAGFDKEKVTPLKAMVNFFAYRQK